MTTTAAPRTRRDRSRTYPAYHPVFCVRARFFARILLRATMKLTVKGLEHVPTEGPVIVAANHGGWLDGPVMVIASPRYPRTLAKSELYEGRVGSVMSFVGQIPVDRGLPDRDSLHAAVDHLLSGGCVGIFPEGTRGAGDLASVQDGLAYLVTKVRCPVVPVAVLGTLEALPRGRKLPRWRTGVRVVFGEPLHADLPEGPIHSRQVVHETSAAIQLHLREHLQHALGPHAPAPSPTHPEVPHDSEQQHFA